MAVIKKILVVDDEPNILYSVEFVLRGAGFNVKLADSGKAAIDQLSHAAASGVPFNLVITDIQMPDMNGITLIDELGKRGLRVPVLVMTGYGDKNIVVELMRRGCEEYIDKPFDDDDLRMRVNTVIEKYDEKYRRLQKVEKLASVGTVAGEVAHDCNNMLGVIAGYAEMANIRAKENGRRDKAMEAIESASHRAASLTSELLNTVKEQVSERKSQDINQIINRIKPFLATIAGKRIRLHFSFGQNNPTVVTADGDIERIVLNLVTNARDAIAKTGSINIATSVCSVDRKNGSGRKPGDYAVIRISDTGAGMDTATKQQIFEPYFSTKKHLNGSGLGLSGVRRIADTCAGWVEVESELNKGSTFIVGLPCEKENKQSINKTSEGAPL